MTHPDIAGLVERLRFLVSLNEPQNGGPYQGHAAQKFIEAATEAATALQTLDAQLAEARRLVSDSEAHRYRSCGELLTRALSAEAKLAAMQEALEPHAATKAAYIGEFRISLYRTDEAGDEYTEEVTVPWTTIKEIMAAIKARALKESSNG